MGEKNIYEEFKKTLLERISLRRDEIVSFDTFNSKFTNLFEVSDSNDKQYKKILEALNHLAIIETDRLIHSLCDKYGMIAYREFALNNYCFDLAIKINNEPVVVEFKTNPDSLTDSIRLNRFRKVVTNYGKTVYLVFLIKETPNFVGVKQLEDLTNLRVMTFETFLKNVFGEQELAAFNEAMLTYKKEMHNAIGFQITEIFNDSNLKVLKNELSELFKSFDYKMVKKHTLDEIRDRKEGFYDLYDYDFKTIVDNFLKDERYELLFGNSDFAKSFLTSEWLYKQYVSIQGLDNTFIVAGFLKTIEQLLWDIAFAKGKGRIINSPAGEVVIDDKYIDVTLGDLEYFFTDYDNLDLFDDKNKFFARYLKEQLSLWRQRYRNGYFHKHNLEDTEKVKNIREETIFILCLILGSIDADKALMAFLQ